jgi:hypothetical protein
MSYAGELQRVAFVIAPRREIDGVARAARFVETAVKNARLASGTGVNSSR